MAVLPCGYGNQDGNRGEETDLAQQQGLSQQLENKGSMYFQCLRILQKAQKPATSSIFEDRGERGIKNKQQGWKYV